MLKNIFRFCTCVGFITVENSPWLLVQQYQRSAVLFSLHSSVRRYIPGTCQVSFFREDGVVCMDVWRPRHSLATAVYK